jgi:prepilin-type N-terminal cleavage/methylation domain-containing protein
MMRARRGYTLIELMVVAAMIAIFVGILTPALIATQRMAESEVALQRAHLALQSEGERIRAGAWGNELRVGQTLALSGEDWGLVDGKGRAVVDEFPDRPGLLRVRVEITWTDAAKGKRTIHTMIYRER